MMRLNRKKLWMPLVCACGMIVSSGAWAVGQKVASALQPVKFKQSSVKAYRHEFSKVAFVPRSKQIATLGIDTESITTLKLWDYSRPGKITAVKTTGIRPFSSASDIAFNPAKNLMAVVWEPDQIAGQMYRTIEVYQLPTRKRVHRMVIHLNRAENLARQKVVFSPDGNFLAFSAFSVRVWNTRDWKLQTTFRDQPAGKGAVKSEIIDYVISPDSLQLATLTDSSQVRLWDVKTGRQLSPDRQPLDLVSPEHYYEPTTRNDSQLEFAPGGKFLYVIINTIMPREAISDPSKFKWAGVAFYKWDLMNHQAAGVQHIKDFTFHAVDFDPQGQYFAMAGYHELSEVALWDTQTFTRIQTLVKGEGTYYDVKLSADGKSIAAAQDYGKLLLWEKVAR